MNNTPYILMVVVAINLIVGMVVLLTNSVRLQNRTFFVFVSLLSAWALCVQVVITTGSLPRADLFIRVAQYCAFLLPISFHALCLSMVEPGLSMRSFFTRTRVNLVLSQICGLVVFTPLFLTGVKVSETPPHLPVPIYGPAFPVVQVYLFVALFLVTAHFVRKLGKLEGIAKAELQFTLLGVACGILITMVTSLLLPLWLPKAAPQQYGPLCIIPINLIIAYGVATHRILDVPAFLQRGTAYLVLGIYLLGLYLGVNYGTAFLLKWLNQSSELVPQLLAALAVAFSVSPVRGVLQQLSYKLFISRETLNLRDVTKRGSEIFASISTTNAILERFFLILDEGGIDASNRTILLPLRDEFVAWQNPAIPATSDEPLELNAKSPLVRELQAHHVPIAVDTLRRMRPNPSTRSVLFALSRVDVDLAIGTYFNDSLRGMVLLGPRKSGRIYSAAEQDALRVLCDQLAVALENANLYTEVQNNKIYNDILVDSLLSGVIAVSSDGFISVFNQEAQRMTGIPAGSALGRAAEVLPDALAEVLRTTLRTGTSQREQEMSLFLQEDLHTPIRYGSSLFHGSNGQVLGALVVFSDQTAQKKLETQVRRSDRLASIGTLSAGMAHEIKNPLVTIKTFTELLPDRYQDEDFRDTFSSLVSKEVHRIDSIVNQLLRFARPAKPDLDNTSLHEIIQNSLALMQEQLRQKEIQVTINLQAPEDSIRADANLLDQAFINFLFNASDAMENKGVLIVSTSVAHAPWHLRKQYQLQPGETFVRLSVRDTGCGIAPDSLSHIFDPFYTTKQHGTGLGLSISHGIIVDHGGLIDVESQVGVGTVFHIYFPLVRSEAAVS